MCEENDFLLLMICVLTNVCKFEIPEGGQCSCIVSMVIFMQGEQGDIDIKDNQLTLVY